MIDHQQDEKVISGYDPEIVRRITRFARPYRKFVVAALLFLVVATAGQVLLPVVIQRTVDHEILDYWVSIDRDARDAFGPRIETTAVEDRVFIREEALDQVSPAVREDLQEAGRLDTDRRVLIARAALDDHPDIAAELEPAIDLRDDQTVAVAAAALEDLPGDDQLAVRGDNVAGVRRNVLFFFLILLGVLVGSFGQVYLTAYTGQRVMRDLRMKVFDHTMHQHLGFLSTQPVGRLVTRATNDVETINELFTSVLAELTRNLSLMVAVVITMYSLNARLASIVLLSMLPIVVLTEVFRRRARAAFRRVRMAVSAVNAYLSEYISGMTVVQLFVQQQRSRREFADRNDELLHANLSEMYVFAVFRPIVDFMSSLSTAVVIFFGARFLGLELVSLGVLIAFVNLIRRFYMPVMGISEQFTILQSAMAGAERVFDLLDTDHRIPDTGTVSLERSTTAPRITFENVTFAYKVGEPVLRNVSFEVEPGQLVAVVGYTGAGKTTIINLLTRLWDVTSGRILIDGTDIRDVPRAELRTFIQQIQQDVHLFSDSIGANITLGADVPSQEVHQACRAVQLEEYIESLPDGLETEVQERGANLSSGQQQLISFARALVHDPPVLVLDEATSSIDSETERRLQHAVEAVTGGRTSLVIAHRLSTIQHADRILVLSHGELVETGTHRQLLAENGLYATLYRLQYAQQDSSHG